MALFRSAEAGGSSAHWYANHYRSNERYFRSASLQKTVDWSRPHLIQFGPLVLAAIDDAIACFAAGDESNAIRWLEEAHHRFDECSSRVTNLSIEDAASNVIEIAVARCVESLLHHREFTTLEISREAFAAHLKSSDGPVDAFCGTVLWLFCALYDRDEGSFSEARRRLSRRKVPDAFATNTDVLDGAACLLSAGCPPEFWERFRRFASLWRRPNQWLKTEAVIYQHPMSYLLSLIWARYRESSAASFLPFLFGEVE